MKQPIKNTKEKLCVEFYPISRNQAYVSQIYAGLYDLQHQGRIELGIIRSPIVRICEENGPYRNPRNHHIFYLEVRTQGSSDIRTLCYDLHDGPGVCSLSGLVDCDYYFKRSYSPAFIFDSDSTVFFKHPELRKKIYPYGLNHPIKSKFETQKFLCSLMTELALCPKNASRIRSFNSIGKGIYKYFYTLTNQISHDKKTFDIETPICTS